MDTITYFKERFQQLQNGQVDSQLKSLRDEAFALFEKNGIPTVKNEEWKYTRITDFFNKDYHFSPEKNNSFSFDLINEKLLPAHENANIILFINGHFNKENSTLISEEINVVPLNEAAHNEFAPVVEKHLGHSADYHKDGINALSTAFIQEGVFIQVKKNCTASHPVYIYTITDARSGNIFAQPRSLVHIEENAQVEIAQTYITLGADDSFSNEVIEFAVEENALLNYYKIQNDITNANIVSTTHVHQTGKSVTNVVTISLNGNVVRNNLNMVMSAANSEANLFGLYLENGHTHIDNHTIVDNRQPNCLSNELYKGILDGSSTGVFNGKIFVRQIAQKTNAYQSNRNILLSPNASINTKPQLEIFADDVRCSHGCTVGQLDEEAMFYMRSRGISEKTAKKLLLHGFALEILDKIKSEQIREYVNQLVTTQLDA